MRGGLERCPAPLRVFAEVRAFRFTEPRRSFLTVLIAIAIALMWQMAAPDDPWAGIVTVLLQGAVAISAARVAGAERRLMRAAFGALAAVLLLATIGLLGFDVGPAIPRLASLALVLIAPVGIIIALRNQVMEHTGVTLQTVWAGLCLYLLLGLAFAFVYGLIENVGGDPFFAGGVYGTSNDFLYFSLATLTTTGYGDFTAATEFGRAMSVVEALAGQIYLVTVVALLVSNLGRTAPSGGVEEVVRRQLERHQAELQARAAAPPEQPPT